MGNCICRLSCFGKGQRQVRLKSWVARLEFEGGLKLGDGVRRLAELDQYRPKGLVTLRDLRRQMRGLGKLLLCQFQIAGLKGRVASMECCVCLFELVRFRWGRILRIRRSRRQLQEPDQEGSSKAARKGHGLFSRSGGWRGLGPRVVLDVDH